MGARHSRHCLTWKHQTRCAGVCIGRSLHPAPAALAPMEPRPRNAFLAPVMLAHTPAAVNTAVAVPSSSGKRPRSEFESASEPEDSESTSEPHVAVLLQGEFADACIRIGDAYQADVPPVGSSTDLASRPDELITLAYEPLTSPPPALPTSVDDLSEVVAAAGAAAAAAAAAAAEAAEAAKAAATAAAMETASGSSDSDSDYDDEGNPLLPDGVSVGGPCLAMGLIAGVRRPFKSTLLAVRKSAPHLLVKYIADATGARTPRLQLPEMLRAALPRRQVQACICICMYMYI